MKRSRLFEELSDMQTEVNEFFNEVHDRLSKIDNAMSGWNNNNRGELSYEPDGDFAAHPRAFERFEQQRIQPNGCTVITEHYERRIYISSDSPRSIGAYPDDEPYRQLNSGSTHRQHPSSQAALPEPGRIPISGEARSEEVLARIEISRLKPGDVDMILDGNSVTLRGKVYRKIMLPPGIDPSHVRAVYRDGVLEIRSAQPGRSRKVEIAFE